MDLLPDGTFHLQGELLMQFASSLYCPCVGCRACRDVFASWKALHCVALDGLLMRAACDLQRCDVVMVCTRGQCASVLFRSPSAPAAFAHTRNAGVYIWRAELHAVVAVLPRCAEICRAVLWCAVQIPLIPLPLPNVTIYFTIWRIISNRSAGQGENIAQQAGKHSIGKAQQAAKHRSQQSAAAGHAQQSA